MSEMFKGGMGRLSQVGAVRHILIFERRKNPPLRRTDYKAMSFEASKEDLTLIQDLCHEWDDNPNNTYADLLPVNLAIIKHNEMNDHDRRVGSEYGLLLAYRGKRVKSDLVIKILNLEVRND